MKLTAYIRFVISILLPGVCIFPTLACGPYPPTIPHVKFFEIEENTATVPRLFRNENLALWQSQTSPDIPLSDIEDAVYHDSKSVFVDKYYSEKHTGSNKFYNYLRTTQDCEAFYFLWLAKSLEERWHAINSPWHYPTSRHNNESSNDFTDIIEECDEYRGSRFRDRYAFQKTRALFASHLYVECITYADTAFSHFDDSNLMKRMAQRYVAGSWEHLDADNVKIDSMFARMGDVWSLRRGDAAEFQASVNPNTPQLIQFVRVHADDKAYMRDRIDPLARKLVKDRRVKNKGDWYFALAFIDNEYNGNKSRATKEIYSALQHSFSNENLKDLARAYKMKIDAQNCNIGSLLADIKWVESKIKKTDEKSTEWIEQFQYTVYTHWIPRLWAQNDFSTAILLCGFADNLEFLIYPSFVYDDTTSLGPYAMGISELRNNENHYNPYDYSKLSFQLMECLSSRQLIAAHKRMLADTPLYNHLRTLARTDKDYFYELAGTIALRKEDYELAVSYLSQISKHYSRTTNIFKAGYLDRDAFMAYPTRWHAHQNWKGETTMYEISSGKRNKIAGDNPKLSFARKMLVYKRDMKNAKTADERGMARLMYAIGVRNSFEQCWALTQYSRGWKASFDPFTRETCNDNGDYFYEFLYGYSNSKEIEERYNREIATAIAMMESDEAKAKAHYILGHRATVVRQYPSTATAAYIRTSCDAWRTWL